jgi:hypothetical protein
MLLIGSERECLLLRVEVVGIGVIAFGPVVCNVHEGLHLGMNLKI